MYKAHRSTSSGVISGEVKLAIAMRILAGGDSLDLAVIFDAYPTHIHSILDEVIEHWITSLTIVQ